MKIYPVNRKRRGNRYCGPAILSIVTGMDTDDASRLIRHFSKKRSTIGTSTNHIKRALYACGIYATTIADFSTSKDRPTLSRWLKENKDIRTGGKVFLISAGQHWQIVKGRQYVCGITKDIVSITHDDVKRRSRVRAVMVLSTDGIKIPHDIIEKMKPHSRYNSDRAKAQKLAKEYGISIELDFEGVAGGERPIYSVWPPEGMFDPDCDDPRDPFVGERMEEDWSIILGMVMQYVDFVKHGIPDDD